MITAGQATLLANTIDHEKCNSILDKLSIEVISRSKRGRCHFLMDDIFLEINSVEKAFITGYLEALGFKFKDDYLRWNF